MPKSNLATPKQVHWLWRLLATAGREQDVQWAFLQLASPRSKIVRQISALQDWLDNDHAQHPDHPDHWHPVPANPSLLALLKQVSRSGVVPTNVTPLPVRPARRGMYSPMALEDMK